MIYDEEKHKTKLPFPDKRNYIVFHLYKKGKVIGSFDAVRLMEYYQSRLLREKSKYAEPKDTVYGAKQFLGQYEGIIIEEEFLEDEYKKYRGTFHMDEARLKMLYKRDLFASYGRFPDHTEIFEKIYSRAWEESHSEGYAAVENTFDDLVDFVDEILAIIK